MLRLIGLVVAICIDKPELHRGAVHGFLIPLAAGVVAGIIIGCFALGALGGATSGLGY